MSESMIGRVAKALWSREHPGASYDPHSQEWHSFLDRSRVAIEAMREPNDVMLAAGQWTISDNLTVSVCVENNRKAAQIWQAMIGKALLPHQEGEGEP